MRLAKELSAKLGKEIKPQQIYGLIRQKKIQTNGSSKLVSASEVEAYFSTERKRGRTADPSKRNPDGTLKRSEPPHAAPEGTLMSWGTGKGKRVAVVERNLSWLVQLRDSEGKIVDWRHDSLSDLIRRGVMCIHSPRALVSLAQQAAKLKGDEELAASLETWLAENA
jgi:hypothetical protein